MRRNVIDTNVRLAYVRGHSLYSEIETDHNLKLPDSMIIILSKKIILAKYWSCIA